MTLLATHTSRSFPMTHKGEVMLTVWWCDGRMTIKRYPSISAAADAISGDCHPYNAFEMKG